MTTELVEKGAVVPTEKKGGLKPVDGHALSEMEKAIVMGDLAKLTPQDRVVHYLRICERLGVDPLTRPFDYLTLNGKLVLYATKALSDQLRKIHGISLKIEEMREDSNVLYVRVSAQSADGRHDEDVGAVSLATQKVEKVTEKDANGKDKTVSVVVQVPLEGDARANAQMKAITKAKRRVTLSICGLGMLDESELETVPAKTLQPNISKEVIRAVTPIPYPLVAEDVQPITDQDEKAEITEAQYQRLVELATQRGANLDQLRSYYLADNLRGLSVADYKDAITRLIDANQHKTK